MNDLSFEFLEGQFGKSIYKELYHLNNSKHTVVLDESTGELMVRKILENYDVNVYEFLKNNPHPNIPKIHLYYENDTKLIVYEEFISGVTLDKYLINHTDKKELDTIVTTVCNTLMYIHNSEAHIVHRDIKTTNIMISNDGIVKLIDFNAAKIIKPESNKDTVLLGTVGYAAPEQYGFGSSDQRTDVYAVGKLIQELYKGNRYKRLVLKATHIDPNKRYKNIQSLLNAFKYGHMSFSFPGFRSNDPRHILLSIVGYTFLVWLIVGMRFNDYSDTANNVLKILLFAYSLFCIELFSKESELRRKLPLISSDNVLICIIGYFFYLVLFFVVTVIIGSILVRIFNL